MAKLNIHPVTPRRLAIRDLFINRGPAFFSLLLKPLPELTHLDLSSAFHNQVLLFIIVFCSSISIALLYFYFNLLLPYFYAFSYSPIILIFFSPTFPLLHLLLLQGMGGFTWLLHLPHLISLTLHNVKDVEQSLDSVVQLTNLR